MSTQQASARAGNGIPLGRPLGIPVYLSPSWLLFGLLVTTGIAPRAAAELPGLSETGAYAVGGAAAVLFALSVLAHELGHSAVSLAMGIPIRRITLFLLGGLAEIEREPDEAAKEYLVAIAGPLVSLFLTGVGVVGAVHSEPGVLRFLFAEVAFTNGIVALFNLLPGLPLDGGRVLRAAVWHFTGDRVRATRVAVAAGGVLAVALGGLGLLEVLLGNARGLFLLLVAAFIWSSGRAGLRRTEVTSRVPALTVRALTRPTLPVPGSLPLAEALRRAHDTGKRLLVVDAYGRPDAVLSSAAVESVPAQRRPWVTVGEVSRRIEPGLVLAADLAGQDVVEALRATPASEYLVVDGERVLGVLATRDVVRQVHGRSLLEAVG